MASEVRRRYRDTAASEVVRAGAQDSMRGAELAGDQCRVRKDPGAESEVDPVPDEIERVVREVQFDRGNGRQSLPEPKCGSCPTAPLSLPRAANSHLRLPAAPDCSARNRDVPRPSC